MSEYEIIILSVALALDALVVSICYGLILHEARVRNSFLFSGMFGFFQFIMPLIGGVFTSFLYDVLEKYSKWIVFAIFLVLAIKFLKSAFEKKECEKITCINIWCLLSLAVATSVDAFGAGVSIKLLNIPILRPSLEIGIITFVLSFIGFWLSGMIKILSQRKVEITGAVMLIYLAIKSII